MPEVCGRTDVPRGGSPQVVCEPPRCLPATPACGGGPIRPVRDAAPDPQGGRRLAAGARPSLRDLADRGCPSGGRTARPPRRRSRGRRFPGRVTTHPARRQLLGGGADVVERRARLRREAVPRPPGHQARRRGPVVVRASSRSSQPVVHGHQGPCEPGCGSPPERDAGRPPRGSAWRLPRRPGARPAPGVLATAGGRPATTVSRRGTRVPRSRLRLFVPSGVRRARRLVEQACSCRGMPVSLRPGLMRCYRGDVRGSLLLTRRGEALS